VALDYLAIGLDPEKTVFFRQSDVPMVVELAWVLSTVTSMGLLERCHSYKDKVAKNIEATHGLFAYPVLMAADILIYDSNRVPVGKDQKQHLEVTRIRAALQLDLRRDARRAGESRRQRRLCRARTAEDVEELQEHDRIFAPPAQIEGGDGHPDRFRAVPEAPKDGKSLIYSSTRSSRARRARRHGFEVPEGRPGLRRRMRRFARRS
jgi:tryptophanyl-tRNA synthetase